MADREHSETSDLQRAATALATHAAFERDGEGFSVTTSAFEVDVRVHERAAGPSFRVTVRVPTLDAVVAGETVAPVVQAGWFETFERRLEDVGGATRTEPADLAVTLDAGNVVVETTIDAERPAVAVADAKAVVDYVEGTFVEGIVPGYTYRDPAAGLLERARSTGQR